MGQIPDQVYGLYLCRGDMGSQGCSQCVYQAQGSILKECPTQIWAVLWYDNCMLRFTHESFYHKMADAPSTVAWNPQIVTSNETRILSELLNHSMNDLVPQVVHKKVKFGTKVAKITSSQTLYTLGQCTLDLSVDECGRCLKIAIVQLPMMLGGRVLLPSCNVRFEVSPFYSNKVNTSFLLSATTNSTTMVTRDKHKRSSHIVIAVSISAVLAVLLIVGACLIRIYNRKATSSCPELEEIVTVDSLQYDFKTIRTATENFSADNKLGEGGFRVVYKGRLPDGQEIAVKRLSINSGQGLQEFKTEVLLVAKLQHKNLVRLLGFCLHAQEKLLVYELLPNSSLDNVLLDFGLARLVRTDQIQGDTNRIVGTYGYMAPEYAMTGRFSVKSDVYSFGVIMLEITWNLWNTNASLELVDQRLEGSYSKEEVVKCIHIGLLCTQADANKRPTMAPLVSALNGHPVAFLEPTPPQLITTTTSSSTSGQVSSTFSGSKDITELYPR